MVEPSVIEVSAVIPCLNEAENVVAITHAIEKQLMLCARTYEIIFIDNGSTDGTIDILRAVCAGNPKIRAIFNTKNFGQMRSPTHGIYQARGAAVIGISADFQDPPELIPRLIERWRSGAMIVLGVRNTENTSALLRAARAVGYGFFSRFGDYKVIPGATGFGLYDKRVVDTLRRWRDPEPFFRGMLVESGFALETIAYHRPERAGGVSKNHLGTLLVFAISGLASSSKNLLRWPIYISLLLGVTTIITLVSGIMFFGFGHPLANFVILMFSQLALGLVMFFIGLLGEQVRLISDMVRTMPLVVERERINFPSTDL